MTTDKDGVGGRGRNGEQGDTRRLACCSWTGRDGESNVFSCLAGEERTTQNIGAGAAVVPLAFASLVSSFTGSMTYVPRVVRMELPVV